MILRAVLALLLLLGGIEAMAYELRGNVCDSVSGKPVQDVIVQGLNAKKNVIGTTLTDSIGDFLLSLDATPAYIYLGGGGVSDKVIPTDDIDASKVCRFAVAKMKSYQLKELEVSGDIVVQTNANTETYIINDALRKNTIDALMLIGKLPGIMVNPMTEQIKIGGDTDIAIFVNGNKASDDYAKSINPQRIKKIEIIRNGSGRYANYPVAMNIVLRRDYLGYDVAARGNYNQLLGSVNDNYEKAYLGITNTYDKLNLYASGSFTNSKSHTNFGRELSIGNEIVSENITPSSGNPNYSNGNINAVASATAEYYIDDTQGIMAIFQYDYNDHDDLSTINQKVPYVENVENISRYKNHNYVGALAYNKQFNELSYVQFLGIYNKYRINQTQDINNATSTNTSLFSGNKDYAKGLINTQYGINKYFSFNIIDEFTWKKYTTTNNLSTTTSSYREVFNIALVGLNYTPKNNFLATIQAKYFTINSNNGTKSMTQNTFSPRISIRWMPSDKLNIYAFYEGGNRNANLDLLSSQRWFVMDRMYRSGNPDLKAIISRNLSLRLTMFKCFRLNYSYGKIENDFSDFYQIENPQSPIVVVAPVNTDYTLHYLFASYFKTFAQQVKLNCSFTYARYFREFQDKTRNGFYWQADLSANWDIFKSGYQLYAGIWVNKQIQPLTLGSDKSEGEGAQISVGKLFKRLYIGLGATFPTNILSNSSVRRIQTPEFHYTQSTDRIAADRCYMQFTARYNFGKGKIRRATESIGYESEK